MWRASSSNHNKRAAAARLRGDWLLFTRDVSPGDSRAMLGYPLKAFVNSRGGETSAATTQQISITKAKDLQTGDITVHVGLHKRATIQPKCSNMREKKRKNTLT